MTTLLTSDIATRIPHRYENLLLDQSIVFDNDCSEFSLCIQKNDALNRDLFLTSMNTLPTPLLCEVSALACIVSSGAIEPGTYAYFAAITQFAIEGPPFNIDSPIHGTTKKISGKNGFYKYMFTIQNNESQASGHLMAYYDTEGTANPTLPSVTLTDPIQTALTNAPIALTALPYKQLGMSFIDSLHGQDDSSALYSYTYPTNHPLIRGHFPNNPVMMGVCQWQMVEDALYHYHAHHSHLSKVGLNALIFKADNTPVCELKNVVIDLNSKSAPTTKSVKKVMFKQRVNPGDLLYIALTDITPL